MSAQHSPSPWEVVEAVESHGFYVTTAYGATICDLYTMTRPDMPSIRNGGPSKPVHFMSDEAGQNARLIAVAPELLEALKVLVEAPASALSLSDTWAPAIAAIAKATGQ